MHRALRSTSGMHEQGQDELSKGLVTWNLGVSKNLKSVRLRKGVVRHAYCCVLIIYIVDSWHTPCQERNRMDHESPLMCLSHAHLQKGAFV